MEEMQEGPPHCWSCALDEPTCRLGIIRTTVWDNAYKYRIVIHPVRRYVAVEKAGNALAFTFIADVPGVPVWRGAHGSRIPDNWRRAE
jgi:hypothetical protein